MPKATAFPMIELRGAPFERGRMYGLAGKDRIARSVALYGEAVRQLGLEASRLRELVEGFIPSMATFDEAYIEEMRGIAAGSGQDLVGIALVNARTEILQLAKRESAVPSANEQDGCTGVVVLPPATRGGKLIHAQNWDWRAECADTGVVLRIHSDDGPDILTFTEAGALARSGLNSFGVALTANYLECDRDYRNLGIPLPLIRRKALEKTHIAMAMRVIATTPKSASNNMIISHADGYAIDFECAPDEAFWMSPEEDLLVHANHWISPAARARIKETGLATVPESLYRDQRVRKLLSAHHGDVTLDHVASALADDWQAPYSVCRPPEESFTSHSIAATVCMIRMTPADGLLEIAPLPYQGLEFTRYELEMDALARGKTPRSAAAE